MNSTNIEHVLKNPDLKSTFKGVDDIRSLPHIKIEEDRNVESCRLYYQVRTSSDKSGFCFVLLEWNSGQTVNWDDKCTVDVVYYGTALFDGIRHIWMAPQDKGYLYYPDTTVLAKSFIALSQLQEKHCSE